MRDFGQRCRRLVLVMGCFFLVFFSLAGCTEDEEHLYWEDGTIQYSGDLIDGVPHGFGTWYYPSGQVAYEGEWQDGRMHGEGAVYCCQDGSMLHKGEFKEGSCDGWGVRYEAGSLTYEGEWEDGLICE